MKKVVFIAALVVSSFAFGYSQSAPNGSSIGFQATVTTPCASPLKGFTYLCATTGGLVQSIDGAAYASVQGAQGPAGTTGASGAQGPQGVAGPTGPQGPAGAVSSTFGCTGQTVDATGIHFSGCK